MKGRWEGNRPASPHKLLNAYVHRLADFTPIDAATTLLEQEVDVGPVEIDTFQWEKIDEGATHLLHAETAANRY
jgi:hypothetical protein